MTASNPPGIPQDISDLGRFSYEAARGPFFTPMPPRKRKKENPELPVAGKPSLPAEGAPPSRWNWVQLDNGSRVAERSDPNWERTQATADLYGATPLLSTGAHMRSIHSILTELVSQWDVHEAELAPKLLAQAWRRSVGEFLATQAELLSLTDGQATVRTSHPAVRYELQRRKQAIIRALNNELGEGCVHKVRIVHG